MTFKELNLIPPLQKAVADAGYQEPSPIQQKAIPPVLAGRDLLGCAQTGTGKTAAFALPILQLLAARAPKAKKAIRALVLTPTRELALQIEENFELYGKYLPVKSTVIFGGVGQGPQVAVLKKGVDILVATPGRLNDLIGQGYIKLGDLEIFVLDEADRMLDMGFVNDVKKVMRELPEKRQTLLFSATIPKEIAALADSLLHKPAKVYVTPPSTTVESIAQSLYKVDKPNKRKLLADLLKAPGMESALVFTRTKHGADRVARELNKKGITAAAIHGNKSQGARQEALARFKDSRVKALVATDIAARGIDINELSHVFNYDLPNVPETYVHRIGRTGRAGHEGIAISFCQWDELEYLADIEKLIGFTIPEIKDHAYPMEIFEAPPKQPRPARGAKAEKAPKAEKGGKKQKEPGNTQQSKQTAPRAEKQPGNNGKGKKAGAQGKAQAAAPQKTGQAGAQQKGTGAQRQGGRSNARDAARKNGPRPPLNPYENRTGGSAIITKTPVWASDAPAAPASLPNKGDDPMANNRNRRRGGRNRNRKNGNGNGGEKSNKPQAPAIPKDEKGVFQFSEADLAEDNGIQVVSRRQDTETKFASFEEYLAAQQAGEGEGGDKD